MPMSKDFWPIVIVPACNRWSCHSWQLPMNVTMNCNCTDCWAHAVRALRAATRRPSPIVSSLWSCSTAFRVRIDTIWIAALNTSWFDRLVSGSVFWFAELFRVILRALRPPQAMRCECDDSAKNPPSREYSTAYRCDGVNRANTWNHIATAAQLGHYARISDFPNNNIATTSSLLRLHAHLQWPSWCNYVWKRKNLIKSTWSSHSFSFCLTSFSETNAAWPLLRVLVVRRHWFADHRTHLVKSAIRLDSNTPTLCHCNAQASTQRDAIYTIRGIGVWLADQGLRPTQLAWISPEHLTTREKSIIFFAIWIMQCQIVFFWFDSNSPSAIAASVAHSCRRTWWTMWNIALNAFRYLVRPFLINTIHAVGFVRTTSRPSFVCFAMDHPSWRNDTKIRSALQTCCEALESVQLKCTQPIDRERWAMHFR